MTANTRWIQYDVSDVGVAGDGDNNCYGTRAYSIAKDSVTDVFTIGSNSNKLYLSIGGESAPFITLYSGSNLDPRFVAKDITEKLHSISGKTDDKWINAICRWENAYKLTDGGAYDNYGMRFKIYSGDLGSGASVVVASGTDDVGTTLGWGDKEELGGLEKSFPGGGANNFDGTVSVSGTYYGFLDECYKIVITTDNGAERGIDTAVKGGGNGYSGTFTTGGLFNANSDIEYVIAIDTSNGNVLGAGSGNVPTMAWTSSGADDSTNDVELLYADFWYSVGAYGLMVKFSDATFDTCNPAWTIQCYKPDYASGSNPTASVGTAKYTWSSDRGDDNTSSPLTTETTFTRLGSRGLYVRFNEGVDNLAAGDEFRVMCSAPVPSNYDISSISYGNVTVSTESDVKCVAFESYSGAVDLSTVRFGLQSHGSFDHHKEGNNDTKFRFGTVGPCNNGGVSTTNGIEWYPDLAATDIDSDSAPTYLYSTSENLSVVDNADDSEYIGNVGLISDPMWMNIKLGSSETGANTGINMRMYYDYS